MKTDEEGRLKVSVDGFNINVNQIATVNNYAVVTTSSQIFDYSPSFIVSTPNGITANISASFGSIVPIGLFNFDGTSSLLPRADHQHFHGNLTGSFLHTTASAIANGFMSSGSFSLLASLSSSLSGYQLTSEKNQPNGYAGLNSFGNIPSSLLSGSNLAIYNSGSLVTSNALTLSFVGFTISSSVGNVTFTNNTSGSIGNIFESFQTASQTVAATPSTTSIKFDASRISNPIFTINANKDTITFLQSGTYHIGYKVSISNTSNQAASAMTAVKINGNTISGSFTYTTHPPTSNGTTTATGTVFVTVAASDTLQIISQRTSGAGTLVTITNGTNILITRWI